MTMQASDSTTAMLEYEIELMQTYARAEASFALVAPDEANPWKGARAKLSKLEQQREQIRTREDGLSLVRKVAHHRTLIGELEDSSATLIKAKKELEEFIKLHSLLMERWRKAPFIAQAGGCGHSYDSYRQWFESNRGWRSRTNEEYEGANWPPEITFSEPERDIIREWLELKRRAEFSEIYVANARMALDDHIRLNPELRALPNSRA